ncbi:MAG: replication initiator protein [Arizlama microvirus]|nr:MAG: replication initiator protein [Arizlama microvirus]
MSCFYPMQALRLSSLTAKGKSVIRFIDRKDQSHAGNPNLLQGLPCGQCTGCRLERSRQWAIRMMNEADCHSDNSFITLTFNDEFLMKRETPMSLDKRDFQLFMKRLRKCVNKPIRYFMCGEYGDLFKRPHYHAILFGLDFPDKQLHKIKDGMRYYTSSLLADVWPFGFNVITDVTFDSCAYVARYIMKKHLGKDAWLQYFDYIDEETGELVGHRIPEYTTMSRRSGIGKAWLDKYLQDVFPRDKIFLRGRGWMKPPKAYDSYYEIINPDDYSRIKQSRIESALANPKSEQQLVAAKHIKEQQIKLLTRNLE